MEENRLERAVRPLYSPDLALSDFDLFSHMKDSMRGQSFETPFGLSLAIDEVLRGIEERTLHAAFLDWMQRLRKCIETNGDCYEEA
jgi:hypothetical protein